MVRLSRRDSLRTALLVAAVAFFVAVPDCREPDRSRSQARPTGELR